MGQATSQPALRTVAPIATTRGGGLVAKSCLILVTPQECRGMQSLRLLVHGILQARIVIFLLQGIFLTQGSHTRLLHYKQILYH